MDSGSIGVWWTQDAIFLRSCWSRDQFEQQGTGFFICPLSLSSLGAADVRTTSVGSEPLANLGLANEEHWQEIRGQEEDEARGFYSSGDCFCWVAIGWLRPSIRDHNSHHVHFSSFLSCRTPETALSLPSLGLDW